MKKIFSLFLMVFALIAFSCSDDVTAPSGGGGLGGGGNGGGGGVTFTVTLQQIDQDNYQFVFAPSTGVVINTITANCPAANINNEQVAGDGTTVFNTNDPAGVNVPANILAQGQVWTFTIAGKIGSSTGTAYSATANHTIQ
jgi:hypothetical protein